MDLFLSCDDRGTSFDGFSSKKLTGFKDTDSFSAGITGKSRYFETISAGPQKKEYLLTLWPSNVRETKAMPEHYVLVLHRLISMSPAR